MGLDIFENKNCFISGATGGIGRQIAIKMAEKSCNLFMTSRTGNLEDFKEKLEYQFGKSKNIFYKHADLNKIDDINSLVADVRKKMPCIDILINCAGAFIVKSLSDSDLDDYETCLNLNLRAVFMFSKTFSQDMVKNKWGRIVNIGSSSAYNGFKETSLYCAAKHALLGFSRSLHDELKKDNIRVFCISPSATKTEMGRLIKNQEYDTFINPSQIAEYIVFLSSFDKELVSEEIRLNRMVTQ